MATAKKTETALVSANGSLDLTGKGKELYSRLTTFVQDSLIENEHYGKIPGVSKPSLFKGGAELLAREADLVPTFEIIHQEIDFDRPLFAFMMKCVLHRDGEKISEAFGSCSNLERKFISGKVDKFFLFNNVPKMAEKRAYVSAVVRAWGISGIFTHDMEDLEAKPTVEDEEESRQKAEKEKKDAQFQEALKVEQQAKARLYNASVKYFASLPAYLKGSANETKRHEWQKVFIGKESTKQWSEEDFEDAINLLSNEADIIPPPNDDETMPPPEDEGSIQPPEDEPKSPKVNALVLTTSEKFKLKQADIINFIEASFITSTKPLPDNIIAGLTKVINDPETQIKFIEGVKQFALWQKKYNGQTETLMNALAQARDIDPKIPLAFMKSNNKKVLWHLDAYQMEIWQDTLSNIMTEQGIETAHILKICPESVPF